MTKIKAAIIVCTLAVLWTGSLNVGASSLDLHRSITDAPLADIRAIINGNPKGFSPHALRYINYWNLDTDHRGASRTSNLPGITVTQAEPVNVALAANGGLAVASSTFGSGHPASSLTNGDRKGLGWNSGGGWKDGTSNLWPDWVEVQFNGTQVIEQVDVFTVQDNYTSPAEPTLDMTFTQYGVRDFIVEYWTETGWQPIPGGGVADNTRVWRQFRFLPVTTSRIRVFITDGQDSNSRLTEIEAYAVLGTENLAPSVTLLAPGSGDTFPVSTFVSLEATASDMEGSVQRVDFYANDVLIATSTTGIADRYPATWLPGQAGSYTMTAVAADDRGATRSSIPVVITVTPPGWRKNVALAANGAMAIASSSFGTDYPASSLTNGDRKGVQWRSGGGWKDDTSNVWPDWVEVHFNGPQSIEEIDVFTLQDNFTAPSEPTLDMTFTAYGVRDFLVEYWTGSQWQPVPGGSVVDNTFVWRQFNFAPVTTSRIRVSITDGLESSSRLTEIEAYAVLGSENNPPGVTLTKPTAGATFDVSSAVTLEATTTDMDGTVTGVNFYANGVLLAAGTAAPGGLYSTTWTPAVAGRYSVSAVATDDRSATRTATVTITVDPPPGRVNVALAANGAIAIASSSFGTGYPASSLTNGDRRGLSWGSGGGWKDGTSNVWPDWVEVQFAGPQTIEEIDIFMVQDNYTAPSEPTLDMTFTTYGVPDFAVEYWTGSQWQPVPGGTVTNNTNVWRQFNFAPVTTSRIRVSITNGLDSNSRLTEIEAYAVLGSENYAPAVTLTRPTPGATFDVSSAVTLEATATDMDGTVTGVNFYANGVLLTVGTAGPGGLYSTTWTPAVAGRYSVSAVATDDRGATRTATVTITVDPPPGRVNVALAANGAIAIASSSFGTGYPASSLTNGDRKGVQWGSGGGWKDGTSNVWPDWVEVQFAGPQTIEEIDVFMVQDNYTAPSEPTLDMTFTTYGVPEFIVEYWTGSQWEPVPGGSVVDNTFVWRQFNFAPVTTSRIRVSITDGLDSSSRLTEIEAYAVLGKVGTPRLSVATGTYYVDQTVVVTDATTDAEIHYTLNGADPTLSDPIIASGGTVAVDRTLTLKARAWNGTLPPSEIATATYTMVVATPSVTPSSGTYTSAQTASASTTTPNAVLRYTTDGSTPTEASPLYQVPLLISTTTTLKIIGFRSGWSASDLVSRTYTINFGTLSAPILSPGAGTYVSEATVSMSAHEGATIRYTTDNTAPTSNSSAYTAPFSISRTTRVRAKAFQVDYVASPETIADYTIATPEPVLSAADGQYEPGTRVTITHADATATIRITLTGADPTTADPAVASGTSLVIGNFTLKARAFKSGCVDSASVAASYSLTAPLGEGVIAAGGSQTLLATPGGRLYAWGNNFWGQLGDGSQSTRDLPVPIQTLTGVTALATGAGHSVAATFDGRVYAWGDNSGDGTSNTRLAPREITTVSGAIAVAAGLDHTLAVTGNGTVYAWGRNAEGQLGLGSTTNQYLPTPVPGLPAVIAVAAGGTHSLALTADGRVYAWGGNISGQLGDGTTETRLSPVLVAALANVVEVAAGRNHSLARLANGDVYAWGYNLHGQLGLGTLSTQETTPQRIPQVNARLIAAGGSHSLALRSDGVLIAWGLNSSGQLGNDSFESSNVPVPLSIPTGVVGISAGRFHSVAVTTTGDVWTWGEGIYGQLGTGSDANSHTPQLAFAADGTWGGTEAPVLSLATGTYEGEQTVIVSSTIPGVILRYTLTGTDPTETDAQVPAGGGILIDRSLNLRVRAWPPTGEASAIASATYALQPATPTISPGTGTYTGSQAVTISCATSGVTLRYTLDGSDPTESSAIYTAPLAIAAPTTVHARAFRSDWLPSTIAAAMLTFADGVLDAPVAAPAGGTYDVPQTVTLSGPAGAEIRYTLDGSEPTPASPLFSAPIEIGLGATTLKASAFMSGWAPSATMTATYSIGMATLTVSTFLYDETAPDLRGPSAGEGVYIRINGTPAGRTLADGTLTLQVPPGDLTVNAIVPSTSGGEATIALEQGAVGAVSIVLVPGEAGLEKTTLVLAEAVDGIIPVASRTFTLGFVRDGQLVPIQYFDQIHLLDRHGDFEHALDDLFEVQNGVMTSTDVERVFSWLRLDETVTLDVNAVDADGFRHANRVRFRVGQFKLALTLAAPPSNPGLQVSNIDVEVSVVGGEFKVRRRSDVQGRIEIEWLPHAILSLDAVTVQGGMYYYGQATMVHSWHQSGRLVLRHVTDVINNVSPLMLDPAVQMALGASQMALSVPGRNEAESQAFEAQRQRVMAAAAQPLLATLPGTVALDEESVTVNVTSSDADVPIVQTATLTVPQGTKKLKLKYNVVSLEYPKWVEEQSPFDDVWTLRVFAGPGGQQLFQTQYNVNAQLFSAPAWRPDSSTGELQEEIDVEALTTEGELQLTLFGSSVNVRDHLFATTLNAQLGGQPELAISKVDVERPQPSGGIPRVDYPYDAKDAISVPRQNASNQFKKWLKVDFTKPQNATITRVVVKLKDQNLADLVTLYSEAPGGDNVKLINDRSLRVRASFHGVPLPPSTPPTTTFVRYHVQIQGTLNGQALEPAEGESPQQHALWRMPDEFQARRYNQPATGLPERDPGGDDWALRGTYRWLQIYSPLITRIDDISGEHGRDIGHTSHLRGTVVDMFHVDTVGATNVTNQTLGIEIYNRLVTQAVAAIASGNQTAQGRVNTWVSSTRTRFDELFNVGPGDVNLLIYALGSREARQTQRNGQPLTVELPRGWARDLLKTGQTTVTTILTVPVSPENPTGQVRASEPLTTGLGSWAPSAGTVLYQNDHNNHIHVQLSYLKMLFIQ